MAGAAAAPAESLEAQLRVLLSAKEVADSLSAASGGAWAMGSLVALLGFEDERAPLAGTLFAKLFQDRAAAPSPPAISAADRERSEMTAACCAELQARGLCSVAFAMGRGGLLAAVTRACRAHADETQAVGCALVLPAPRPLGTHPPASVAAQLFHESPGRVLLAIPAARYADATLLATSHGVPLLPLGRTGGRELVIRASDAGNAFREVLRISLAELFRDLGR
jgi:phosphoribosylformylglycinamidine (FGAM) synthase-like enzyme